MEILYFPAVKTFIVPDSVPSELAGDYASAAAANLIVELGLKRINPKSLILKALDVRTYALHYTTNQQPSYKAPPPVEPSRPNPEEHKAVEASPVAIRNQEGPSRISKDSIHSAEASPDIPKPPVRKRA